MLPPKETRHLHEQGIAYARAGRHQDAKLIFEQALLIQPRDVMAMHLLGIALLNAGSPYEARVHLAQSLRKLPPKTNTLTNLARAELACLDPRAAAKTLSRALALEPTNTLARLTLADALSALGQLEEALKELERVEPTAADQLDYMPRRIGLLLQLERFDEAVNLSVSALASFPASEMLQYLRILSLYGAGRTSDAEAIFRTLPGAVARDLATVRLAAEGLNRPARKALSSAMQQAGPDIGRTVIAQLAMTFAALCDAPIAEFAPLIGACTQAPREHQVAFTALIFALQHHPDANVQQIFDGHKTFGLALEATSLGNRLAPTTRSAHTRLRLGFVSGDLREHAVAHFLLPVLPLLGARYDLYAYSTSSLQDDTTTRFKNVFHHWRDCVNVEDVALRDRIVVDEIDILVDLSGHTTGNRLGVFAMKPAPVQVTWIGYGSTTGLSAIDYRISDWHMDPPGAESFHTETLVRLPGFSVAFEPYAGSPNVAQSPFIKNGYITFGYLNKLQKANPALVDRWSKILKRVPNSRLILIGRENAELAQPIALQLNEAGIDAQRIRFVPSTSLAGFLELHGGVDIALDAYPYSGGTTTFHSLWMGVPVVSVAGDRAVSRQSLSTLARAGLEDLCSADLDAYVECAVSLASDSVRLTSLRKSLRDKIRSNRENSADVVAAHLIKALDQMWHNRANQVS